MSENKIQIEYFTDVLCVWAWVAQKRVEELESNLGNQIKLKCRYIDVFGDVPTKIESSWAERGRYQGYADHVQHVVDEFEDIDVHADTWTVAQPRSSANIHLILKAAELVSSSADAACLALRIRQEFFGKGRDVGELGTLYLLARETGLDCELLQAAVEDGRAMAALMHDYRDAKSLNLRGSPSYVLDGGRQILYGNVGYKVLEANIEALIRKPVHQASWC